MKPIKYLIGTLFGVGLLPGAPGTWGSFFSLFLIYPIALQFGLTGILYALIISSIFAIWTADVCVKRWGNDPSVFVIDEFAGQALVFLFITFTGELSTDLVILFVGFLLFRIFDIVKPLGIKQLQQLPLGFGILVDDIIAGVYALICLHLIIYMGSILL